MSRRQNYECADMREETRREPLLRHYRRIGAPAIVAALDIEGEAAETAQKPKCEARDALPPFLLGDSAA